ncbi:lipopolysaccharide biosynthesis protein [Lysinibacillus yapensis]|uniref:Lipopolysaccharide biosynthesis protein n=1 Tax=Ureibacillus yapensis TaxID=2304605 RepID=A0A396SE11_9BACL|nr:oligosaccharide flippase family protein [Lysinibacillus yapensis]RHW39554.1 lipopolysaccharide biosynthesis protein [Lysinibacillus yapensis]
MDFNVKKIVKKPFVRNVIIMASGTAAAQLVGLLLQPVITRFYGPEAYGLMGIFVAIIAIIGPIAALTYPIAIVLPKSDKDAIGLIRLSLYISTGISAIVGLLLLFFSQSIVRVFQIEDVAPFIYLLPLIIFFAGCLQVTEQWFIRKKQFRVSAQVTFLQALVLNGSKVGIGFFYPVASVLIIITVFGSGLKAFMMIMLSRVRKEPKLKEKQNKMEKVSIKELGKRYRDFPVFRAPETFLSSLSQNLPALMLTSFFGPASAGFYTIGKMVLQLPTNLIGKSVSDVFYPRISEAAKKGENLTSLIKKATFGLGVLGIIPFGLVFFFGPWLFSFVFGEEWLSAGEYARWMALWVFFGFMNRPSVMSLPVLSAQDFQLKYTVLMLIIRIIALAIGYYGFQSDEIAIALFGICGAILNIGLIIITLYISKKYDKMQGEINENIGT